MSIDRQAIKEGLLAELGEALNRSRITGMCTNCWMPFEGEHVCAPEEAVQPMIDRAWRHLLGDNPQKRAKGYAVQ